MMIVWLPDPPPDFISRFIGILIAGIVGGALGGYVTHAVAFDALPGMVGAAGAGAILSAFVAAIIPRRAKA
jgi:Na+/citrate or Na+/malate symporter